MRYETRTTQSPKARILLLPWLASIMWLAATVRRWQRSDLTALRTHQSLWLLLAFLIVSPDCRASGTADTSQVRRWISSSTEARSGDSAPHSLYGLRISRADYYLLVDTLASIATRESPPLAWIAESLELVSQAESKESEIVFQPRSGETAATVTERGSWRMLVRSRDPAIGRLVACLTQSDTPPAIQDRIVSALSRAGCDCEPYLKEILNAVAAAEPVRHDWLSQDLARIYRECPSLLFSGDQDLARRRPGLWLQIAIHVVSELRPYGQRVERISLALSDPIDRLRYMYLLSRTTVTADAAAKWKDSFATLPAEARPAALQQLCDSEPGFLDTIAEFLGAALDSSESTIRCASAAAIVRSPRIDPTIFEQVLTIASTSPTDQIDLVGIMRRNSDALVPVFIDFVSRKDLTPRLAIRLVMRCEPVFYMPAARAACDSRALQQATPEVRQAICDTIRRAEMAPR